MKTYCLLFVLLFGATPVRIQRSTAAEFYPAHDSCLRTVSIHADSVSLRLDVLEHEARSYLKKQFPNFSIESAINPSIDVNILSKRRPFIRITYYGAIGTPYWQVLFDKKGRITGSKDGITTEGHEIKR